MSKLLIVAEFRDGRLKSSVGELVAAARQLGGEVHGVLLGQGSQSAAAGLGAFGITKAFALDGDLPAYSSDAFAAAVAAAAREHGYNCILLSHSFTGRDLAARLAALLDAACITDVTAIVDGGAGFLKPLYAGKVVSRMKFEGDGIRILTLRGKVLAPAAADQSAQTSIEALPLPSGYKSKVTGVRAKEAGDIDVKDAEIIITGGRGVGGPEGFAPLREFSRAVGCALGASRAAVDAGWIGHSHQVGQTGKVVNPKLYIACGVSGAIQHLAGMQTSKVVVAINSNENAPIFKVADYGLVGDLFEIVPELQKQILALREQ